MAGASYQTVRIARGRHKSPAEGACVMELASMLAGEAFTDRPRCVDPVLGAYLRAFNDRLGPAERQRLYPYAAASVGTRADRAIRRLRRDRCLAFSGHAIRGRNSVAAAAVLLVARLRIALLMGVVPALRLTSGAGELAAREVSARHDTDTGLRLLDALLRDGGHEPPEWAPCRSSTSQDIATRTPTPSRQPSAMPS